MVPHRILRQPLDDLLFARAKPVGPITHALQHLPLHLGVGVVEIRVETVEEMSVWEGDLPVSGSWLTGTEEFLQWYYER